MTYREAVAHGEKVLELSHIADAKTDAWLLLEMGCKIDRKFYYMHMEDDLPDDLLKEYELAIKKRAEHCVSSAYFYSFSNEKTRQKNLPGCTLKNVLKIRLRPAGFQRGASPDFRSQPGG